MNCIKRIGSGRPHKTALIFGDQRMIYQEPDEVAARCTSALREQGIHKGDRVIHQTDITRILSWWGQTPGERIQPGKNIAIFNLSYFYHPGFGTM